MVGKRARGETVLVVAFVFMAVLSLEAKSAIAAKASVPTPTSDTAVAGSPAPVSVPNVPERPAPVPSMVNATFETSVYGFVELDVIHDSTQSLSDAAGNAPIARAGTLAGDRGRTTFSIRDSRLGFKLKGPSTDALKTSGVLEMDFLGSQPQNGPAPTGSPAVSETAYFASPTFRARHYFLKLATPYVDLLAGQTWSLFGWQGYYFPNMVQVPGVPGELAARTPQVRLSHVFEGVIVGVEAAVAAARPAQRDSETPDGVGAVRFIVNQWRGLRTFGATGTGVDPLSVGISGMVRRFRVPEPSATPRATRSATGWGVSVDALLPVIRTTGEVGETALTLTASYVRGRAIADQYTGFTGGVTFASLGAGAYPQNVDPGLVAYSPGGSLQAVGWESFIVGAQLYLPLPVRAWIAVNASHISSSDMSTLVTTSSAPAAPMLFDRTDWADVNFFVDANSAVRFGIEYAWTRQRFLDGRRATNHRVQLGMFYSF